MNIEQNNNLTNCKIYLANGEVEIALQSLLNMKICENEIIMIFNRWNTLKEQLIKGIVSIENYNLEKNKIVNSTLELIEKIKIGIEKDTSKVNQSNKSIPKMVFGLHSEITNGSILVKMIQVSDAKREPNTDSISSEDEANLIGEFLSEFQDYIDYVEVVFDIDPKYRLQTELKFNKLIKELNKQGFRVFGEVRKMGYADSDLKFNCINISILREKNDKITKDESGNLFYPVGYVN